MKRYTIVVQAGLLLIALSAVAAVRNGTMQIKVLDSETRSVVLDDSGVPKNCDVLNFDAYCHNSITTLVTNTLLLQEGDNPPFRVSCRVDTMWSRCTALPKGSTFDAKRVKRGITVYLVDERGRLRQQLYSYGEEKRKGDSTKVRPMTVAAAADAEPAQFQPPSRAAAATVAEKGVKCSFTSTPRGAEINVDGHYAGSTPSVLSLDIGDHAVEVSLPEFVLWKRNLTLSPGSEVTVNAVLKKLP